MALLLIGLLGLSEAAQAQRLTPRPGWWVTNSRADCMARTADTIYMGGSFSRMGPYIGSLLTIDTATAEPSSVFPQVNGAVYALVPDGLGGYFIGGHFSSVGGQPRKNVARLLADGTLDPGFLPDMDGKVMGMALGSGTLYMAGQFTTVGGLARANLAAVDTGTGEPTTWTADTDGIVNGIAIAAGVVCVGGNFNTIAGQALPYFAALDTDTGAVQEWEATANGPVNAMLGAGNKVYVGGTFTFFVRGNAYLSVVDATTGMGTDWDPQLPKPVKALTQNSGTIFIADGTSVISVSKGNHSTKSTLFSGDVKGMAASSSRLYAGLIEQETIGGEPTTQFVAYGLSADEMLDWGFTVSGTSHEMCVDGNTLVVGGYLSMDEGIDRNSIAAVNARTGVPKEWSAETNYGISAMSLRGDTLYIGGPFTQANGQTRNHGAAVDAGTGALRDWNPNADNYIETLLAFDDVVYAGGWFVEIGGEDRDGVAALDPVTGNVIESWVPERSGLIEAMTANNELLFLYGSNVVTALWRSDGSRAWSKNISARAMAATDQLLIVGGNFSSIGGQPRERIAALIAATGQLLEWNPGADRAANSFSISGNTLYVGGIFDRIGGQPRKNLAAVDLSTGIVLPWNPTPSLGAVTQVIATSGSILALSEFPLPAFGPNFLSDFRRTHSADMDEDFVISLAELLRVIQLYNADSFGCNEFSEDGYEPIGEDIACEHHAADFFQNWHIELSELLRVMQLFGMGAYYECPFVGDGFCPGEVPETQQP